LDEVINYTPSGKVARKFHKAKGFVKGLMGCVGSGKSSACCVEIVNLALQQPPSPDGVRKCRALVIRNTYPELKSTTIKTWEQWFPHNIAPIKWDTPITSTMNISDIGDGTALHLEVWFIALDKVSDTGRMRSLEVSICWINECSEVPKEIFDIATQRVGRYPRKADGGFHNPCVLLDTNPPDDDSYYFRIAEEETPKGWKFFRQAGGLYKDGDEYKPNPDAENIDNLPNGYNYYLNMLGAKDENWINVFVLGNYGSTSSGKPVFPEFKDKIHTSEVPLEPIRGLPIVLGWDFGLTPSCVIMQQTNRGQIQILEEIVSEDMGIRQFASDIVRPILINKYGGYSRVSTCDPSGNQRSQVDERSCVQELFEIGIPTEIASTNDWLPRREAVAFFLTRMNDGKPAFLLDKSCKVLRKGMNGKYQYQRLKVTGTARYRDRPLKDDMSHIQDALQYACLRIRNGLAQTRARSIENKSAVGWT
tara:strand:+ start:179 stop:1609 length:1431 start_codon:yes stop_codon:yes gene_type:complete